MIYTWKEHRKLGLESNPNRSLFISVIRFPFVWLFILWLRFVILRIERSYSSQPEHRRNRSKYKKVVKEGVLWDTIEYHER